MKLILLSLALLASNAYAGSAESYINCVSASGRTTVTAVSHDLDITATQIIFTIDGKAIQWDNGSIVIAAKEGVYTITAGTAEGQVGDLVLSSYPKSNKIQVNNGNALKTTFKAKVYGTDPRSEFQEVSPVIEVNCSVDYEI